MKKKLEAELISIAHRVLKLKNREETVQLHNEVKQLYEKLTILRFYEENFESLKDEISAETLEEKLDTTIIEIEHNSQPEDEMPEVKTEEEPVNTLEKSTSEASQSKQNTTDTSVETEKEPSNTDSQAVLFDDVVANDYKDLDFVRVDNVPKEVEQATETSFEAITTTETSAATAEKDTATASELKAKSINDNFNNGISFGLNDRIAFEKRLFNGSSDDFNRVLSQLNTFGSYEEAKGFIDAFVKPDYNNWEGKEEFETRFLESIEKKFS